MLIGSAAGKLSVPGEPDAEQAERPKRNCRTTEVAVSPQTSQELRAKATDRPTPREHDAALVDVIDRMQCADVTPRILTKKNAPADAAVVY